jgi:uncharacterized protein (TIGR01777 family)
MRVAVTGSSGLIGSALCRALSARGHTVRRVVRRTAQTGEIRWDPATGTIEAGAFTVIDAVVHLAGAGIGDRRWTPARKEELVSSRVQGTALLARTIAAVEPAPSVLVSASAVGIYGDRGDEVLTESSALGSDFLADLCQQWEAGTGPAAEAGVRVVHLRSGIVLSPHGGVLGRQLPLFRMGLGGRLGNGRQWTSWISIDDEVRAILFALERETLAGPVNATAPAPVTNAEYSAALGRALHRPAVLAVPPVALRAVLGSQLVDEALLASQRVEPAALSAAGFTFDHPEVGEALRALLRAPA